MVRVLLVDRLGYDVRQAGSIPILVYFDLEVVFSHSVQVAAFGYDFFERFRRYFSKLSLLSRVKIVQVIAFKRHCFGLDKNN